MHASLAGWRFLCVRLPGLLAWSGRTLSAIVLSAAAAVLPALRPAAAQCPGGQPGSWTVLPAQQFAGPLSGVVAVTAYDPDGGGPAPQALVAGGTFRAAGASLVQNVAMWDGATWGPLRFGSRADALGLNGTVTAFALYNGELIAAGQFTASGPTVCNRVARWTADGWRPLGSGLNGSASALAVYNGRLYASGSFSMAGGVAANRVASWDGGVWRSLGTAGENGGGGVGRDPANQLNFAVSVNALRVFDGHLYIGGAFDLVNGATGIATLARWDGAAWSGVSGRFRLGGSFPIPEIHTMGVFAPNIIGGSSSTLYVGGEFDRIDVSIVSIGASNIASYTVTGTERGPWQQVGTGLGGPVRELLVLPGAFFPALIATSSFSTVLGEAWTTGTYRFTTGIGGSAWNLYATERPACLASFGGEVVGGLNGVSRRIGSEWLPYGRGLNGVASRVVPHGGDLYAFGGFTVADGQVVQGAARLAVGPGGDGGWHPVGVGVLGPAALSSVADAESTGTELFVMGEASSASGAVYRVLRFNGATWSVAGEFQATGVQRALHRIGNDLYLLTDRVRRWNGLTWVDVGGAAPGNRADALYLWDGALHLGAMGGIYRLSGATWLLAFPLRPQSFSAGAGLVWNGRLFASMSRSAGPLVIDELVGGVFAPSFEGVYGLDYEVFGGLPVVLAVGGTSAGLARFDGSAWSVAATLDGGSDLALHAGGRELIIAGTVSINGAIPSPHFARLTCCRVDFDGSGSVTVVDIFAFLSAWFTGDPRTDFDGSGGRANVVDIFVFLSAWFVGCG